MSSESKTCSRSYWICFRIVWPILPILPKLLLASQPDWPRSLPACAGESLPVLMALSSSMHSFALVASLGAKTTSTQSLSLTTEMEVPRKTL